MFMKQSHIYRKPDYITTINVPPHPTWATPAPSIANTLVTTDNKK
jgi:hypothetical protein